MKKLLYSALSMMILVSCGGKASSGSSVTSEDTTQVSSVDEAVNGAYILTEDVALKVRKLLGENVLIDFDANPLAFDESQLAERTAEMYDVMEDSYLLPYGDAYLGFNIVCLKRNDGKYAVIHKCMNTYEGCTSVYMTDYYILDGDKLVRSGSIFPEIKPTDIIDEFDDWYYSTLTGDKPEVLHEMLRKDEMLVGVRKNDDNTRDVWVKIMYFGGRWFKWNGESLSLSDEVYTRDYMSSEMAAGFVFDEPLPDFPDMKSYKLDNDGNGNVTLMRNSSPAIKFKYENDALVEAVALSKDFCEVAGTVFRMNMDEE